MRISDLPFFQTNKNKEDNTRVLVDFKGFLNLNLVFFYGEIIEHVQNKIQKVIILKIRNYLWWWNNQKNSLLLRNKSNGVFKDEPLSVREIDAIWTL